MKKTLLTFSLAAASKYNQVHAQDPSCANTFTSLQANGTTIDVGSNSSPTFVDIDHDGDLDLVSGERDGNFNTFLNDGSNNFSAATGAANPLNGFAVGFISSPTFVDIDGDGDLDLVSGGYSGTFYTFFNDGNNNFSAVTGAANPLNGLDVGSTSSPTFVDIDGDGDLDLVSGEKDGYFHTFLNDGSNNFSAVTGAANPLDGFDVGSYSAPTFVDIDGDEDLDLIAGDFGIYFNTFLNDGSNNFSVATGAANPLDGLYANNANAPTFVDIDGDRDLDLIVGELTGRILVFDCENILPLPPTCSDTLINLQADNSTVDVGFESRPTFVDIDGDSDLDLVSGGAFGTFYTFLNDGFNNFSAAIGAANPLNGFDVGFESAPTFVDIDGDGDLDVVSGERFGTFYTLYNFGSIGFFDAGSSSPLSGFDVGARSAPTFVDIDNDGDLDLVSGAYIGVFYTFLNDGYNNFTQATGASNPLNGIDVGFESSPTFVDIDNDGDLDLVSGERFGTFTAYLNDGSNNFSAAAGSDNPLYAFDVGDRSSPTFVDIDGDRDLDLVSGENSGTIQVSDCERVPLILPIKLNYFTASKENDRVLLQWQTASEINNSHFIIEHSTNGIDWNTIDRVNGAGDSTEPIDYSTYHHHPMIGTNFYRLLQVDFDGTSDYSDIEQVVFSSNHQFYFSPNPAYSEIVFHQLPENVESLQIFDAMGNLLEVIDAPSNQQNVNVSNLPKGIYFIQINTAGKSIYQKMVKQ